MEWLSGVWCGSVYDPSLGLAYRDRQYPPRIKNIFDEPEEDGSDPPPPYWAFPWAGGMTLARHILVRPGTVTDRRVLDLGAGSGLVAIAAAMVGASEVVERQGARPLAFYALNG